MEYHKISSSNKLKITTLKALKDAGYQPEPVKEELRRNLIAKLKKNENDYSNRCRSRWI